MTSPASHDRRARRLTAAYYAALFFGIGAHLPFWPVWLAEWGLTEAEIGQYLGLALILRTAAAAVVPAVADRLAARRLTLGLCAAVAAIVFLLHLWAVTRPELLALTLAVALAMAPLVPLGEALGLRASERAGFGYAPVRAVGSIAFLAMNLIAGAMIHHFGPDVVLWTMVVSLSAVAVLGLLHPGGGAPAGALTDRAGSGELRSLLRKPVLILFAAAVALGQGSHAAYYAYSAIDWAGRGIDEATVGMLWATGVVAEIALLLGPGRRLISRLGPSRAIALGAGAGVVRWSAMAAAPGLALLWPLQALHAFTFAAAHLGAMAFLAAAVPARMIGSAQGMVSGLLGGVVMAGATLAGARLAEAWGTPSAYLTGAALSATSLLCAIRLGTIWKGEAMAD